MLEMDKLRKVLSGNDGDEERGIVQQVKNISSGENDSGETPIQRLYTSSLSWETRIKGFIACFVIGFLLSLLGSLAVFLGNFTMFGVLYTVGSLTAICSTCFLMGPVSQIKKMFAATRFIATIVMLISLVMTLVAAFVWSSGAIVLIFVVIQFLAMTWYSLSYIPYARDAVKKCFEGCIN